MVKDIEPFLFVGGSPALDFVNTEIVVRGAPVDLLRDEADLARWISVSGLASPGPPRKRALAEAKALRADLRRIFVRLASGEPLRPSDLDGINAALATADERLHLELRRSRPLLEWTLRRGSSPAFLIARAGAEFLATADLSLVRQCQGSGCILLFHDTTKSHTRRWCSMAFCGNRAKAAAHYQRLRK